MPRQKNNKQPNLQRRGSNTAASIPVPYQHTAFFTGAVAAAGGGGTLAGFGVKSYLERENLRDRLIISSPGCKQPATIPRSSNSTSTDLRNVATNSSHQYNSLDFSTYPVTDWKNGFKRLDTLREVRKIEKNKSLQVVYTREPHTNQPVLASAPKSAKLGCASDKELQHLDELRNKTYGFGISGGGLLIVGVLSTAAGCMKWPRNNTRTTGNIL